MVWRRCWSHSEETSYTSGDPFWVSGIFFVEELHSLQADTSFLREGGGKKWREMLDKEAGKAYSHELFAGEAGGSAEAFRFFWQESERGRGKSCQEGRPDFP